jgi:hypothetical protein
MGDQCLMVEQRASILQDEKFCGWWWWLHSHVHVFNGTVLYMQNGENGKICGMYILTNEKKSLQKREGEEEEEKGRRKGRRRNILMTHLLFRNFGSSCLLNLAD